MNLCTTCRADFASLAAFDKHRVGRHAYTFAEGLAFDPPCDDGRRCLDAAEMVGVGMEFDSRGRWRIVGDEDRFAALRLVA